MSGPEPDHQLLQFTCALFPTPDQAATFDDWCRGLGQLDQAVKAALLLRARPHIHGVVLPVLSADELADLLEGLCRELLVVFPPGVRQAVVALLARRWRPVLGRPLSPSWLAQWPSPIRVPLDTSVQIAGELHVHIAGLPALILSDHWRLPLGLTEALDRSAADHQKGLLRELHSICQADQAGQPGALVQLHRLTSLHGPLLQVRLPGLGVDRRRPHRARHATLRRLSDLAGQSGWGIDWSVRLPPDWLPRTSIRDTVGVDPGIRYPLTWADATTHGQVVPSPLPTGNWHPPGLSSPLADAFVRRAQFERVREAMDAVMRHLLTYECIAVERTVWSRLAPDVVEAMALTGVTDTLPWLAQLAKVTGSRVRRINPAGTTVRCGRCGRRGQVEDPWFICPVCPREHRDINSSRRIRRDAQEGWR